MPKVKRQRITCRLPRQTVADLDSYIERRPWMDRSAVVGEAVAALMSKHGVRL